MWFLGYIATPVLFSQLESRQMAGMVAGHLFGAINYTGLICGGLLLLFCFLVGDRVRSSRSWLLALMLLVIVVNQFLLQPMMAQAKLEGLLEGSESAARFGRLHGISSILYLINSVLGLVLLLVLMPTLAALFQSLFNIMFESMRNLLTLMGNSP